MRTELPLVVRAVATGVRPLTLRLPFRFGAVTLTSCPQLFVRATVEVGGTRRGVGQPVHGLGQRDVALGDAAGIMRRERHLDLVVDVEPFRMMVELLRNECGTGHEAERRVEVLEGECPADGVAALHLAPAVEPRERGLARASGQFLRHGRHLVSKAIVA